MLVSPPARLVNMLTDRTFVDHAHKTVLLAQLPSDHVTLAPIPSTSTMILAFAHVMALRL